MDTLTPALAKGCLAGLGLVVLFAAIGGLAYLLLTVAGLPQNIVLLIAIASGPILGTVGLLVVVWQRTINQQIQTTGEDETTSRHGP
jgi:hypothetical protein